jgi:outer membrane protein OmpA-like peptidoglycan-associated protein
MMPFARKRWVKRQTEPINDRLTELDQLSARNASDIKDTDQRAQAGIQKAQSTADSANQVATAAGTEAQQASTTAQAASGHVSQLNTTVDGLDQYKPVTELDVAFRGGNPVLSEDAKSQLDQLVTSASSQKGYIVEIEAHNPARGSAGIENSRRLGNVVDRYLVEHDIPVYRVHMVALGNAPMATATGDDTDQKPVKKSSVHVRLMENSLAARDTASPQGAMSSNGAERP